MNASNLQIGDRVGFCRMGNWGDVADHGFGKVVTKITKTGQITVENEKVLGNTRRFNKHGDEMSDRYSKHFLIEADKLERRIAARDAQRQTNRRAKELLDEIQKHKTGMGDYHFDEEARGKLLALVAQL